MIFDADFFKEHQKTLLGLLNSPIGGSIRRGLWIPDTQYPIAKLTHDSYHVRLPGNKFRAVIHSNKQHTEAIHRNYRPLWERIHAWDMRFANRFMPALNMGFDSYSSQPDDTTGIDTFLESINTTTNYSTDTRIWLGENNAAAQNTTTLIKFDFTSITSGASCSAATLTLTTDLDRATNTATYKFWRSLRAFVENQATWAIFATGNSWGTAGARNASTDYGVELASLGFTATETVPSAKVWNFSNTEMENYFDGTYANNGFIGFETTGAIDSAYAFASSSHATAGSRPKFDVTYTPPGSTNGGFWWGF